MDLGIRGRKALVCGASSGLGRACAQALAEAGVDLVITARSEDRLETVAEQLRGDFAVAVQVQAADLNAVQERQALLQAAGPVDILVTNGGGPPAGNFRDWGDEQWMAALQANMVAPIQLIRGVVDGMAQRKWGRIVNITSYSAKLPLPLLGLSNGARSGLIGFVSGMAREVAPLGITVNNLLPGNFDTERLGAYIDRLAAAQGSTSDRVRQEMAQRTPVGRIGRPEEFGAWCAFLCSRHAAYVTAQNYVLDGGTYPGTY